MYQTLYRKYRPNNLEEVVGQEVIVKTLKNAILNNKLNHAYLFTGPRGTGKTSVAKILAKTVNCEKPNETNPCNNCVSCTQINNKQSVDIIEIDAASNNGVDEIRELRNKVSLVPATSKYKVYIIDEVHMLTTGAFNALLKTLEEPPSHIIFILATTEPHKIPATILSRCQRFDFKKISVSNMISRLKLITKEEGIEIKDEVYSEICHLSDGCMRDALGILDQLIAYTSDKITLEDVHEINGTLPKEDLKHLLMNMICKDYEKTFNLIEEYDNKGKNFVKLTEEILLFLRNILLDINVPNYSKNKNEELDYTELKEKFNEKEILDYIKKFNTSIPDMKKANNARILFEMIVIELMNSSSNLKPMIEPKKSEYISEVNRKQVKVFKANNVEVPQSIENNEESKEKVVLKELSNSEGKVELSENFNNLRKIRINNTLCNFNKKQLIEFKKKIEEVRNLLLDPDYSKYASMILDGELKAYGDKNIIFVYQNDRMASDYNYNVIEFDNTFKKAFNEEYKSIAVDIAEWDQIKKEFNNKEKTYEYIEEPSNLKKYLSKDKKDANEIDNMFGKIVEYN